MADTDEGTVAEAANGTVQSVDRAMTILEILSRSGDTGVTEIAAHLGVHKSTAFRLLATLEAHRMVEQLGERGLYRLGVGNLRLAGATTARLDVVTEAREACRRLAKSTGETINVAVLADTAALYVDQVAGNEGLQAHNWVGQRIPLHATSNGKVLLSELSDDGVRAAVVDLPRLTERTITDRDVLATELAHVREVGYALANNELEVGLSAVAAPIRNVHNEIVASISVSGPSFRLTDERLTAVIPELVAAASEISHRLGWWGHS
jgi:DNA-binding IclR family transcriptional regulator